ncbi:MAG: deoxyguanosinetriphosphate triphosphohydrolase [Phycisphaerae bacterium]|nr:deoxyguanosinetriphosphate triphosphohydrolase [Phycisphaerae bacterium]
MNYSLAQYAVANGQSRGRNFQQKQHPYRSGFDRDRDRIIHCAAFRRLEGKTQVFSPGLDDYYRTRLTHTIEVAQIGRTIARALRLNESLTEAICLGHDLGHCPFGHLGERIMNDLMADFGGFEHNMQTLRIVDVVEHPYADFAGLNLMFETRLGLAKHKSTYDDPKDDIFRLPNCTLEGQIADLADRIAYNCHDLEDGLRARLIRTEQLRNIELFQQGQQSANVADVIDKTVQRTRTAKAIIDILVSDCIETSEKKLKNNEIKSSDEVCEMENNLITISEQNNAKLCKLEKFLLENFYLNPILTKNAPKVEQWLGTLFEKFCKNPELMPGYFVKLAKKNGLHRTVCDYIAGMTDRFCLKTLEKLS